MKAPVMRSLLAAALGLALATSVVVAQAQAPKQIRVFAGVLDSTGAPAKSLAIGDVHVMEDGADATVTKVEPLDWPVKLQLLVDNGVGLGGGSIQPLKAGVQSLLAALPENLELTIVGTAPQPRFLARPTTDRAAMQQGIELLASDRGVGRFVESLLEATQRIERDASDFFPIIVSVATTSGDRNMKESDVARIMARLAARPTTVHVVLYTGGPQGVSQAGHVQGAAYAGTNQIRVGMSVAKYSGGTYDSINNATQLASLLPEIGKKVAAAVVRHRQQFRITADRPAGATGDLGKVNVGVKSPLVTAGLSFDGPVP
jgi:hypothetical protein